jgi:hypothetical protein
MVGVRHGEMVGLARSVHVGVTVDSRSAGTPTHSPPAHRSSTVHASPSSHGLPSSRVRHRPVSGSQVPVSQGRSHSKGGRVIQAPLRKSQNSGVQRSPSELGHWRNGPMQFPCWHESSSVQGPKLSLQGVLSSTGWPWQIPSRQVSSVVHAFPSSHGLSAGRCTQPVAGSHSPVKQGPEQTTGWFSQVPVEGAQYSRVHAFPSSGHSTRAPTHSPSRQVSSTVHRKRSSQTCAATRRRGRTPTPRTSARTPDTLHRRRPWR